MITVVDKTSFFLPMFESTAIFSIYYQIIRDTDKHVYAEISWYGPSAFSQIKCFHLSETIYRDLVENTGGSCKLCKQTSAHARVCLQDLQVPREIFPVFSTQGIGHFQSIKTDNWLNFLKTTNAIRIGY